MSPQLLILGLPRTGTQSLADALKILGYRGVYHMREVGKNGHHAAWAELVVAKAAGREDRLTKRDFEPLLQNFDAGVALPRALADFPAAIFGPELIKLYPEAKVIITDRSEDSWVSSMSRTVVAPGTLQRQDQGTALRSAYNKLCWDDDFDANGQKYWREYNRKIRELASPDNLLVFELGEGWDRLCEFLGKAIPGARYPNNDEARTDAK